MKKADYDYTLQVGDIISVNNRLTGIRQYKVIRVTPKYAFVKYNHIAEGKFPRVYNIMFGELPKKRFDTREYEVYCNE